MTTSFLFSSNLSTLYKLYETQKYEKACAYGTKYLYKHGNKKNEKYLTLYGLSCLETDHIERLSIPIAYLNGSKDARANASYFSTILLQKHLLMQTLIDEKELVDLHLPKTTFVLSKVFSLFVQKRFTVNNKIYKLEDETKADTYYKIYIKNDKKNRKYMIIDTYKNDKFTQRYRYE